ncbi:aldehyde dehydrogenase family protein [Novosphingobium sp. JCM 18896]|uniref:aldehyde dehydrogenase family protein n=1 Tax=Novosphingobium sp. JCM 18896 TaxID=2989731 RepID=UPI0022229947|nr:aldehyde dehydrogenase family protein [Novosphingobium sp. JCM 18896]MCW1428750.1 aldehyde dehydrogenase family protein [Novosphingobium sp. JCM 18896]
MSTTDSAFSVDPEIVALVSRARIAQADFESFDQDQVDAIVRDIGKYVYDNAETLARMAVDETGIGNFEDKVLKKKGKARAIWNSLKGKKSRGIIGEDEETQMVFVAKPMGVVGAVTPITNPIVTPMCNGMFALKTGNAVIFAPHPKAQACAEHLTEAFMAIVRQHGGPEDLIQVVRNGSISKTQSLMESVDVVVATGGGAMVKSAYSSGKPSFGVGAGNVPVIIDRGVDLAEAVGKIVTGASFDNGIICSHEQFVLAPQERFAETVAEFTATGKVWFTDDPAQVQALREVVFPGGQLNKDVVGIPASEVGRMAGIAVPDTARLILLPAKGAGEDDILAREKLCPVVAILPYESFEEAVQKAKANLLVEGAGHSAALHSHDEANIRHAGLELPISRLVVNQPSSLTAGGSLTNGFAPTTTLGCGSWGGNSISENLDYKHLMNVSRIGKVIANKPVPSDEEIWA